MASTSTFVDLIVVLGRFAGLRIENLFFDPGMHLQSQANFLRKGCLAIFVLLQFIVLIEPFFDLPMVLLQQLECIWG